MNSFIYPRVEVPVLNSGSRPVTINSVLTAPATDSLAVDFTPVKVIGIYKHRYRQTTGVTSLTVQYNMKLVEPITEPSKN